MGENKNFRFGTMIFFAAILAFSIILKVHKKHQNLNEGLTQESMGAQDRQRKDTGQFIKKQFPAAAKAKNLEENKIGLNNPPSEDENKKEGPSGLGTITYATKEQKDRFLQTENGKGFLENFKDLFSSDKPVVLIGPADPNEPKVPFNSLTPDCAIFNSMEYPVVLRVSGDGSIIEAVPLVPLQVPQSLFSCHLQGGPATTFSTTFTPAAIMQNSRLPSSAQ